MKPSSCVVRSNAKWKRPMAIRAPPKSACRTFAPGIECVMRAQGATESDPNRVQLDTPEDLCRESLGMANRNAIPTSFEP